jgi:hypothetical protein
MLSPGEPPSPRPAWLRALGRAEPPTAVTVAGLTWCHERTIKHDSWAATAVYVDSSSVAERREPPGGSATTLSISQQSETDSPVPSIAITPSPTKPDCLPRRLVIKFNRTQPLGLLPLRWLGRWLAAREAAMYRRLAGIPGISAGYRRVECNGKWLPNASAHDFIDGHPLRWHDQVEPQLFQSLHQTLRSIHQRSVAYVDLNKWENIIVDPAGMPHLIDFQISLALPRVWPLSAVLRVFQHCDLYHLSKHAHRVCPQHFSRDHFAPQPWWIRFHRRFAEPFRAFRRKLLVRLGVRRGAGKPQSEGIVEEGLRTIGNGNAPIEQLYRLLGSADYAASVEQRGGDFFATMFHDLIGRPPVNALERDFITAFATRPRHDQIIWLLKSELFLAHTGQWSEVRVEAIRTRLARHETKHEFRAA